MRRSGSFYKTSQKKFEEANTDLEDAFTTEVKQEEFEDIDETPEDNQPESELLPGPEGQPLYYDGIGYYYNETSEEGSLRLLHCSHSGCGVRAQMDRTPGAPITLLPTSEGHAHQPNIARRERIRFLHSIKTRHNSGDSPFHVIFQEEAKLNPLGASFFSFEKIENHLKKKAFQKEPEPQSTPNKRQLPTRRSAVKTKPKGIPDLPTAKKRKIDGTLNLALPNKLELLKKSFQNIEDSNHSGCQESSQFDCGPSESGHSRSNNSFQETEKRNSAKLVGPEFFHNFKGYYYYSAGMKNGKRYLRCLVPTCMADACMSLEDNAEICPLANSRPHNHKPDLTTNYNNKIKQIESCWSGSLPSERLPSFRQQFCCFYDRKGFYYHQSSLKDNIRYLVCIEPTCSARAHMCIQKDSSITVSPLRPPHNHPEDPSLRDALLFIDAARVRVRSGVNPYVAIEQEKERNLDGANRIDLNILELCLKKMSEIGPGGYSNEDMVDFDSSVKSLKSIQTDLFSNVASSIVVQNHFDSILPILDLPEPEIQDDNGKVPQQENLMTKERSERVPALLHNSWLYHDCNGFYYTSVGIAQDKRYLECVVSECGAQGWMSLEPQAPICTLRAHSHGRQPSQHRTELWFYHKIKAMILERWNESVAQVYSYVAAKDPEGAALISEEDAQNLVEILCPDRGRRAANMVHQPGKIPSERLPGPVFSNSSQYHDGEGFYYYKYKKVPNANMWYLRCVCATCPGKAIMAFKEGSPITLKYRHSHRPELLHYQMCLFTNALKKRTRDESTPLRIIYSEESNKYPDAAAVMQENRVKRELLKIRRYLKYQMNILAEGDDENDTELLSNRTPHTASEVLQSSPKPVYLDGRGYYFTESFSTDSFRYLMCMEPQCLAQAKMLLVSGAPVVPQLGAAPHNHAPDPLHCTLLRLLDSLRVKARSQTRKRIRDIYQEAIQQEPVVAPQLSKERLIRMLENYRKSDELEENLLVSDVPAERIPSHQHQGWLYHDGRGYYYYCQHTDKDVKRRVLKCCDCEASAWLEMEPRASIMLAAGSVLHNHTPDTQRRELLLVLHRIATRVSSEALPYDAILEEETKRHPEIDALIAKEKMKEVLEKVAVSKFFKEDIESDEEEFNSEESSDDIHNSEYCPSICETLQSISSGQPVYADANGFYYRDHRRTSHKLHLVCIWPLCKARAFVLQDTAEMFVPKDQSEHNHEPDPFFRNKLVFVNNLRKRVLHELTTINTIYNEEANREPIGADMVNDVSIKNFMYKLRKYKTIGDNVNDVDLDIFEDFDEAESESNASEVHDQLENEETVADLHDSNSDLEDNVEENFDDLVVDRDSQPETPIKIQNLKKKLSGKLKQRDISECKPSEKLPCRSKHKIFYNGEGYYYQCNIKKNNIMYLRCADTSCKVRAWKYVDRDESPVVHSAGSPAHNHQPNFDKRNQLLFLHRCKLRAAAEDTPLNYIWLTEVARDPKTAKQMSQKNVKGQMKRYRQERMATYSEVDELLSQNEGNDDSNCDQLQETDKVVMPQKVPSLSDETLWHAAGFFYLPHSSTPKGSGLLIKCKCVNKDCSAHCKITTKPDGSASISCDSTTHNHPANLRRKDQLLFINRCKRRAADSQDSVDIIYNEEAVKYPEVAKHLSASRVKQAMMIFVRKTHQKKCDSSVKDGVYEDDIDDDLESIFEINEINKLNDLNISKEDKNEAKSGMSIEQFESEELGGTIFDDEFEFSYSDLRTSEIKNKRSKPTKLGPKFLRDPLVDDSTDAAQNISELENSTDPQYSDFVTLEEDSTMNPNHEEVADLESEPDFNPSPKKKIKRQRHFHDGNGYYFVLVKDKKQRWLKCRTEKCPVTVPLEPKETPPLKLMQVSPSHPHPPEFTRKPNLSLEQWSLTAADLSDLSELENLDLNSPKSNNILRQLENEEAAKLEKSYELVHGRRPNCFNYHDRNGFYYIIHMSRDNFRYLRCVKASCKARAYMSIKPPGPLVLSTQSPNHNHLPDLSYKKFTYFLEKCKMRAASEETPIKFIYEEETDLDPESAAKISKENLMQRMSRIRNGVTGTKSTPATQFLLKREEPTDTNYKTSVEENQIDIVENALSALDQEIEENEEDDNHSQTQDETPEAASTPEEPGDTSTMEVDEEAGDYYHNEDQQQYPLKPSEIIPGLKRGANNYHDGHGFYYEQNRAGHNIRYLKCSNRTCRARAFMEIGKKNAPIILTNFCKHNHGPDHFRKRFTTFLRRVTQRAAEEDTLLSVIYREEAARDPESASHISMENVKQRMKRYRHKLRATKGVLKYENLSNTSADQDGSIFRYLVEENKGVIDDSAVEDCHEDKEDREIKGEDTSELDQEEETGLNESSRYETVVDSEIEVESSGQNH